MFTQGLVVDLIEQKSNVKWQLALVDIDEKALEAMRLLCQKVIKTKKSDVKLTYSTDRKEVLQGADFVVSTIGVGGRRAWEQDVFIPRKYGIYQPVGDSVAPGGISRAMRMIPAMLDITYDVMELCPDAYFFNYANPMTSICRAVRKETGFPIIGLCHGVKNGQKKIATFAGFDNKKATSLAVGINHFTIMYDIRYEGIDIIPKIIESLIEHKGENNSINIGKLSREFVHKYNAYPATDDRHYVEYVAETMKKGNYYGKTLGIDEFSFEKTIKDGDEIYEKTFDLGFSDKPLPDDYFIKYDGEHEELMNIIESLIFDKRRLYSINIPNEGAIPKIPWDSVVEIPAVATARGFLPVLIKDYPKAFSDIINKHLAITEITINAAINGDRDLFAKAIMQGDPSLNETDAVKMVDELIRAQSAYLPQF